MKVVFYTAGPEFDGASVDRVGVGGSESALTYTAREFAKLGFETHVYCNCRRPREYSGVLYHDVRDPIGECDYLFCYRYPEALPLVKAKVKVFVLHDAPVIQERIAKVLWAVDMVFFLSEYQKGLWLKDFPSMEKISVLTTNGFDEESVSSDLFEVKHQVVYASRPERGLDVLLEEIWPKLLEKDPDLKLVLAGYGSWSDSQLKDFYRKCDELIAKSLNVVDVGSLSKEKFYGLLKESKCVVYPLSYPEISCLIAIESSAVGTPIVASDSAALPETVAYGTLIKGVPGSPIYNKEFVSEVLRIVNDGEVLFTSKPSSWSEIAKSWEHRLHSYERKAPESIAACVIAKNEEGNIVRCLKSLKGNVDFIKVLVDSSQDNTLVLAKQYADYVRDVSFDGLDFAEMRREMTRDVKQDWILWIDADEILMNGSELRKYTASAVCEAYRLKQVNVRLESTEWGQETPIRFFKNQEGVSFIGKVHEQVEFSDDLEVGPLPLLEDVSLLHLGYVAEDEVWEKLLKRNKALLEAEVVSGSTRPLLSIYVMRDLMNEFVRAKLSSKKVLEILNEVILIWVDEFEEDQTKSQRKLAWKLYQKALAELQVRGILFEGETPKYVRVELELDRGGSVKSAAWYRSKSEYFKRMASIVQKGGDLLWK